MDFYLEEATCMLHTCTDLLLDYTTVQYMQVVSYTVHGTCVLWIPWDHSYVSYLSRCPNFPGQFI